MHAKRCDLARKLSVSLEKHSNANHYRVVERTSVSLEDRNENWRPSKMEQNAIRTHQLRREKWMVEEEEKLFEEYLKKKKEEN